MKKKVIIIVEGFDTLCNPINTSKVVLSEIGVTNIHYKNGKFRMELFRGGWGWGVRFARHLAKHYPDLEVECWNLYSPEYYLDLGRCEKFVNGVRCIQLPAFNIYGQCLSLQLIMELKERIVNGEKIIVHLQKPHSLLTYIVSLFCNNTPLVAQQRGPNCPPMWSFKFNPNPFFFLLSIFNRLSLINFDHVFASSVGEISYLESRIGPDRVTHIKGGGFRFDEFKIKPKSELRKELSLPQKKKLMIHVGQFVKSGYDKGIPVILQVSKILKKKSDQFQFVFIGGNKKQELYNDIISSGAIVRDFIPGVEARKYINACDINLLPSVDKKLIPYSDISTSMVESWAFNTPVISPFLIHFLGADDEQKKLGLKIKNTADVIKAIEFIFDNYSYFTKTRPIVEKYYNWDRILKTNTDVYERLYSQYYNDESNH